MSANINILKTNDVLLEAEAFALRDGPLEQPGKLVRAFVLRQHDNVKAGVGSRQMVRVRPRPLNLCVCVCCS